MLQSKVSLQSRGPQVKVIVELYLIDSLRRAFFRTFLQIWYLARKSIPRKWFSHLKGVWGKLDDAMPKTCWVFALV